MLTKAERAGIIERIKRYDGDSDPFYYILFGYPSACDMPYEEYGNLVSYCPHCRARIKDVQDYYKDCTC